MIAIKTYWREIAMAIMLVIIILLVQDCNPQSSTVVTTKDVIVKTPEITGNLTPSNQSEIPSAHTDSIIYKDKYVFSTHPFDRKLAEDFANAKDSITQFKKYLQAIQVKEQVTDFSNKDLELKVRTKIRGELLEIKADYKIRPQEITVQEKTITNTIIVEKKDKFGTLVGAGYNQSFDTGIKSSFEVNAGFRIGKVNILGTANTAKQIGGKILIEL